MDVERADGAHAEGGVDGRGQLQAEGPRPGLTQVEIEEQGRFKVKDNAHRKTRPVERTEAETAHIDGALNAASREGPGEWLVVQAFVSAVCFEGVLE